MKILILLSEYLPDQNPNVFRWSAIGEHWVSQGHEVHVLTPKRHDVPPRETIGGVEVWRSGHGTLLDWAMNTWKIRHQRGRTAEGESKSTRPSTSRLRLFLEWLVSITWRRFYWPDGHWIWQKPAANTALEITATQGIDAVITVCYPFSGVLAGQSLKRLIPGTRWIIDVEDPFSIARLAPKNNLLLYDIKNRKAEQACFDACDGIAFTNATVVEAYAGEMTLPGQNVVIIPPLWQHPGPPKNADVFDESVCNCAYIGAFYEKVREPEPLLVFLNQLIANEDSLGREVHFHLYGSMPPILTRAFQEFPIATKRLHYHGFRERSDVFHAMQQMDFLINVGNATDYQLPSKVVDYYASGRPVINLRQIENDSFDTFFVDYPLYRSLPTGKYHHDAADLAVDFILATRGRTVDKVLISEKLHGHSVEAVAKAYLQMLKA